MAAVGVQGYPQHLVQELSRGHVRDGRGVRLASDLQATEVARAEPELLEQPALADPGLADYVEDPTAAIAHAR